MKFITLSRTENNEVYSSSPYFNTNSVRACLVRDNPNNLIFFSEGFMKEKRKSFMRVQISTKIWASQRPWKFNAFDKNLSFDFAEVKPKFILMTSLLNLNNQCSRQFFEVKSALISSRLAHSKSSPNAHLAP